MLLPCRYMSLLAMHLSDERADDKTKGSATRCRGRMGERGVVTYSRANVRSPWILALSSISISRLT